MCGFVWVLNDAFYIVDDESGWWDFWCGVCLLSRGSFGHRDIELHWNGDFSWQPQVCENCPLPLDRYGATIYSRRLCNVCYMVIERQLSQFLTTALGEGPACLVWDFMYVKMESSLWGVHYKKQRHKMSLHLLLSHAMRGGNVITVNGPVARIQTRLGIH